MKLDALQGKLTDYLKQRLGSDVTIANFALLSGGASQDNYGLNLTVATGDEKGDYDLVMRTDKGGTLLQSVPKEHEFRVIKEASDRGVVTPKPYWFEADANIIGNPFYFVQKISGKATGRFIVKDRELNDCREQITDQLAENMALIHSIKPNNAPDLAFLPLFDKAEGNSFALASVQQMREHLVDMPGPYPAAELCLNWLEANAPETDELVLIHGDFRTGNYLCNKAGLQGIVDWEMTHWGDRYEDISWISMRCWRFGKINKPIGGIADREGFYAAYEKKSGVKVDMKKVLYWEIMGNVRWAVGAAGQGNRHLSGQDKGIDFASIGRISGEMEYEAMSLIEQVERQG